MVEIITVTLPKGYENWKPDPFPGSDRALDIGCTCPINQPHSGRLRFAADCSIHELEQQTN